MSKELHSSARERLAYTRDDVAGLLQVSLRHVAAMEATGRLGPRKLKFGRAVRYLASEIQEWLEAGAPARDRWDAMKAARRSGARA